MKTPAHITFFIASLLMLSVSGVFAQAVEPIPPDTIKPPPTIPKKDSVDVPKRAEKLIAFFDSTEITIAEGDVFSKNLRIVSNTDLPLSFRMDVSFPAEWKPVFNPKRIYTINPGDTFYVPVRLVPLGKIKGNTKYMINAYLFDTIGTPITSAYMYAARPKLAKWNMSIGPHEKIYFKNDSNQASFTVNVGNDGTESQEIYMSLLNFRKDVILLDSNERIIKKPNYTFVLPQFGDTTFKFGVRTYTAARNLRRLDTEGYLPGVVNEPKTYSFFIKTSETSLLGAKAIQKAKKVEFIKLPNQRKISPYGIYSLPLRLDFNISNLLSNQPAVTLALGGYTNLDNGALLTYNTQMMGILSNTGTTNFQQPFFNVGYHTDKYSIRIGDVGGGGGGVGVGGKGINASYTIDRHQNVNAFYVRGPVLFGSARYFGAGAGYNYVTNFLRGNIGYVHIENKSSFTLSSDYINTGVSLSVARNHGLSFSGSFGRNAGSGSTQFGMMLGGAYNGRFFNNRLITNVNSNYISKFFTFNTDGNRWMVNHSEIFKLNNKWAFRLLNQYQYFYSIPLGFPAGAIRNRSLSNTLTASTSMNANSSTSTGIFYNIYNNDNFNFTSHSRGLIFNYNYTAPFDNIIFGANYQVGYNRIITNPTAPEQFFMNLFIIAKYRVYSFNFRYLNGSGATGYFGNSTGLLFTQQLAANFIWQYQFRNPHFVLDNLFTYNLMPQADRHSLGYTPELNFFSKNGWRLRVTAGYYFTSSKKNINNPFRNLYVPISPEDEDQRINTSSYLLMFGARKEFGVPLPFVKRTYPTIKFKAFVDVNGNGKPDGDETMLENVVVKLNGWEVLTNEKGEALLQNLPQGEYPFQAFSLDDVKDFFPHIEDKLTVEPAKQAKGLSKSDPQLVYIPFVKGIKLYGKVYANRERFSAENLNKLDLSGIRITSTNGKKTSTLTDADGGFLFYLPYGKYIISMDEKILGDQFNLLQNDIEVTLNKGISSLFISFYIAEKRRKVSRKRFGPDGKLIEEVKENDSLKQQQDSLNAESEKLKQAPGYLSNPNDVIGSKGNDDAALQAARKAFLTKTRDVSTLTGLVYTIQLGAFQKPINPAIFNGFTNLLSEQIDNNFIRVAVGTMRSMSEAKAELINIQKVGFTEAYITVYYNGKQVTLSEAERIKDKK